MGQRISRFARSPAIGGAAFMVSAGLLFAGVNICVQAAAMRFGLPSASIAFWQYLIALGFAVPWLLRRGLRHLKTGQLGLHLARVVLAAAGVQFWVLGLAHVPIWQAIALIMTSPFFVTAGAGLFLKERVGPPRWLAVAAGFAGGMIILAPWSDAFGLATFYPLVAAALWAAASLLTKRLTVRETAQSVTVYLLLLLTPINAVVAAVDGFAVPAEGLLGMEEGQDSSDVEIQNPSLHGIALRDLRLPSDIIILSVNRGGRQLISHGYTRLRRGDSITIVGSKSSIKNVSRRVGLQETVKSE